MVRVRANNQSNIILKLRSNRSIHRQPQVREQDNRINPILSQLRPVLANNRHNRRQRHAKPEAIAAYHKMEKSQAFRHPIPYAAIDPQQFDLLLLPGGHAKGMRQYLGSGEVQDTALAFMQHTKLVGAICHGVLVLARTIDPETGHSVLRGRRLTGLTKRLERTSYYLTFWRLGDYYRTYPEYVEVLHALEDRSDFLHGGSIWKPFVVEDANLITARYPADANLFAQKLVEKLT